MAKGPRTLEQYLSVMPLFAHNTSDRRLQGKRKYETCMESALEKIVSFFFLGPTLLSTAAIRTPPIFIPRSRHKRNMPVAIILLAKEDP